MTFGEVAQRAIEIREKYVIFERAAYGRSWTDEELMLGFTGDVGDLAKLVLAQNGVRNIPDFRQKLAHELSDCLWSVLVLANAYDIDLEDEFLTTMRELESHLSQQSSQ